MSIPLPIIASNPHFLDAHSTVQNAIVGLTPDEIFHRSFADVEPVTGSKKSQKKQTNNRIQSNFLDY